MSDMNWKTKGLIEYEMLNKILNKERFNKNYIFSGEIRPAKVNEYIVADNDLANQTERAVIQIKNSDIEAGWCKTINRIILIPRKLEYTRKVVFTLVRRGFPSKGNWFLLDGNFVQAIKQHQNYQYEIYKIRIIQEPVKK